MGAIAFIIFVCLVCGCIANLLQACGCIDSDEVQAAKAAAEKKRMSDLHEAERTAEEAKMRKREAKRVQSIVGKWADVGAEEAGESLVGVLSFKVKAEELYSRFCEQATAASHFTGAERLVACKTLQTTLAELASHFDKATKEKIKTEALMRRYLETGVSRVVSGELARDSYETAKRTLSRMNDECNAFMLSFFKMVEQSKTRLDELNSAD
jgi:hypothetical protein